MPIFSFVNKNTQKITRFQNNTNRITQQKMVFFKVLLHVPFFLNLDQSWKKLPNFAFFPIPPPYHLSGEIRKLISKKRPFLEFYLAFKVKYQKNASISMFWLISSRYTASISMFLLFSHKKTGRKLNVEIERAEKSRFWYWKCGFIFLQKLILPSKLSKIPHFADEFTDFTT